MAGEVVPLNRKELAKLAPNYEAMRNAIAVCERVDEIANLANQAVAAQAYFSQSQDIENEMHASRIRVRAERKLGELLRKMAETGQREKRGGDRAKSRGATLVELGIPKDRASRAMQLADVPEEDFEAALEQPRVAQPRRILDDRKPITAEITRTLNLWGRVRDLGSAISSGDVPPLKQWRSNLQPFQLEELKRSIPVILKYLSHIHEEL